MKCIYCNCTLDVNLAEPSLDASIVKVLEHKSVILLRGGARFESQLIKSPLKNIFNEFNKIGKVKHVDDKDVDRLDNKLTKVYSSAFRGFNDFHIVALSLIGVAKIIFSKDKEHAPIMKKICNLNNRRPLVVSKLSVSSGQMSDISKILRKCDKTFIIT